MRGGYRKGAGRPPGSSNVLRDERPGELSEAAKAYSRHALEALVDIAVNGRSELARVSAANSVLDRAFGKVINAPTVSELQHSSITLRVVEDSEE
jgi:hypothetical protein